MTATHDHPLPGDLVIRPIKPGGLYFICVYPQVDRPAVPPARLSVIEERARVVAAERGGTVQVWLEDERASPRFSKIDARRT